jgi:hypothetical protein
VEGGQGEVAQGIQALEALGVDADHPVISGDKIDPTFDRLAQLEAGPGDCHCQPDARFVLVDIALLQLEDVHVLFAQVEEGRDVLRLDDVAPVVGRPLELARDDPRHVVRERPTDGVLHLDGGHFHNWPPQCRRSTRFGRSPLACRSAASLATWTSVTTT